MLSLLSLLQNGQIILNYYATSDQKKARLLTSKVRKKMIDSKEKYCRVARLGKISKLIKKLFVKYRFVLNANLA